MTVINGIEIDNIKFNKNIIKTALVNNNPIEDKLNVIIVVSNPMLYARRYILAREFIKRCEMEESEINLYIVELVYKDQKYILTDKSNKNHLQLKTDIPIWHKENMINLGVKYLLPKEWKSFAWIDADIEFESTTWALDTLKLLNGAFDIIQLWSHCADLNYNEKCMQNFTSAGYQYIKNNSVYKPVNGIDFSHPGYAWAITRKAYEKIGGLYEHSILGSGDHNMLLCLFGCGIHSVNGGVSDGYKKSIKEYEKTVEALDAEIGRLNQSGSDRIVELESEVSRLNDELNSIRNLKYEYESVKSKAQHIDTFRSELEKSRKEKTYIFQNLEIQI